MFTAAYVKRLETKPTCKWTRAEVQSAFEELGVFLARLIGEPAQKMVQDAFQMLDVLFDQHRRDRDVVDWTYLACGRSLAVQVVSGAPQMDSLRGQMGP